MSIVVRTILGIQRRIRFCRLTFALLLVSIVGACDSTAPQDASYVANRQFPEELLARARKILPGRIAMAWESKYDWLNGKIVSFSTYRDQHVQFLHRDGVYLHVNAEGDYSVLNEILSEFTFTREEFSDPNQVEHFLGLLTWLWEGSDRYIGSSVLIRVLENCDAVEIWLGGREKDERVLRYLCRDPQFLFEREKWTVVFNAFRMDGSVDQWHVSGRFDEQTQTNRVDAIAVHTIKRAGTFDSVMMG